MSNNIMCPHCDKEIALEKIQELSISKALKNELIKDPFFLVKGIREKTAREA